MVVQSTLSDHDRIVRLERLVMEMRDKNDNLKERIEEVVADIKEGKIACNKCTVAKGNRREVPYIPKQVLTKMVEAGKTKVVKVLEKEGENTKVPAYRNNVGAFAHERREIPKQSWSTAAKEGDKNGFTKVVGKAEKKTVAKKMNIVKQDVPQLREQHLKITFLGERGVKYTLPDGVSPENIRVMLNLTLKNFNIGGYFSIVGRNRWGDIELTLARTRAEDLVKGGGIMTQALEEMELAKFEFVRDTKKVKLYVAMVPLMKDGYGREWKIEDWQEENSFDRSIGDIERSNPGIHIKARPTWVGKLNIMKETRQTTAGMILLREENEYLEGILKKDELKILVAGRKSFCRIWREKTDTTI